MNEPREWAEKAFDVLPDAIPEAEIAALSISLVEAHTDGVVEAFQLIFSMAAMYADIRGISRKVLSMMFMAAAKDIDRMEH